MIPSLDKATMRSINQFKVLYTIRDQQPISRSDVVRETGLSPAAVSGITGKLIAKGLLRETEGGATQSGRRPVLLTLNPDGAYSIGIFVSVGRITVVIVNLQADILAEHISEFEESDTSPEAVAEQIVQAIHQCMWKTELTRSQISGIGIAIPGLVMAADSMIKFALNYSWRNVHFKEILQRKLAIPVYIDNSVRCISLSEQWFGEGKNVDNFIVIYLAQGVAVGIVVNGQLYGGQHGAAGEFGHTIFDPGGDLCRCGKRGCMETFFGNHSLLEKARRLAREGCWQTSTPLDELTLEEVVARAMDGEAALVSLYREAGWVLGIAVSNLIEIFNPEKVIISGKGTMAGALIEAPMRESVLGSLTENRDSLADIVFRNWKYSDTARGAGVMVLQEIYQFAQSRLPSGAA